MSGEDVSSDPQEILIIQVTSNAVLEASRFCIEQCGMYGEAQIMAVNATVMGTGNVAAASWNEEVVPEIQSEGNLPNIVMKCKGPRKKYFVAGPLVCRKSASVDTA